MTVRCGIKSLPNDDELAIEAVRLGVMAYRAGGDKTLKALAKVALHVTAISSRRVRGLFFREHGRDRVAPGERHLIRMGVARAIRAQIKHLELRQIELKDIANQIEREEAEWGQSVSSSVKRVA